GEFGGLDANPSVADRVARGFGQRPGTDEPLQAKPRLDGGLAPGAVANGVYVRTLLVDDPPLLAERGDDRRARLEPVQPLERPVRGDDTPVVHDREVRQAVTLADLKVVGVVRGRHLDRTGAELRIDMGVGDDRDPPPGERQLNLAADEMAVAIVVGVNR